MVALGNVVPSNAATLVNSTSSDFTSQTVGEDVTQGVTYTEQDEVTNQDTTFSGSYETEVYETKASKFSFVIPKTITLDGESNEGTYQVKVKGNITGNQTISITTPETFELAEQNATVVVGNKATATIASEADGGAKTIWNQSEIDRDDYTGSGVTEGIIHSDLVRAGSYKGAFDFTVELKDAPITKAAGAYDVDGNLICELTREEVEADYNYRSIFEKKEHPSEERNKIVEVVIPEGTTKIGSWAFSNCTNLTTVNIPNSVTSIGDCVFYDCKSLTTIDIPDSITTIGSNAFSGCTSLATINIPDSVTSIGGGTFYRCSNLTTINIPDSMTSISGTFNGCTSLTSIDIPDSVTSIGQNAFRECSNLKTINIPDSVTEIGNSAFGSCTTLTTINIPDGVTSIKSSAFWGCANLTTITIPDSVTTIENSVFECCSSLSSITYKDTTYTSKSALTTALTNNGVSVGSGVFNATNLQS